MRLRRDGTRAETRFRLSPKRASPFKSAGASVQSTAGSRGVRISVSNAGYTKIRGSVRVLATHSTSFPFTSPPVRHRVPSGFKRTLHPTHNHHTLISYFSIFFKLCCPTSDLFVHYGPQASTSLTCLVYVTFEKGRFK